MRKPNGYWTKEKCAEEASKYSKRSDFEKGTPSAYDKARRNRWLDEICAHMVMGKRPNGYWTKENCAEEAAKYNMRKDFQNGCSSAYSIAHRNGWLDEICSHMGVVGHRYQRYVYEFKDPLRKIVYVGLTYHPERRLSAHKSVSKYITKHFGDGQFLHMSIVTGLLPMDEAARVEDELIEKYRTDGYHVINTRRGGGLGANHKMWTKETCEKEALKYETRSDFSKGSSGAYTIACREGWIDDICGHMVLGKAPAGHWTKENVIAEARKYKTLKEFRESSNGCFTVCYKKGWENEACDHMDIRPKFPNGHWDIKENCRKEASKYLSRGKFAAGCSSAYVAARRNGWLDEFFPK